MKLTTLNLIQRPTYRSSRPTIATSSGMASPTSSMPRACFPWRAAGQTAVTTNTNTQHHTSESTTVPCESKSIDRLSSSFGDLSRTTLVPLQHWNSVAAPAPAAAATTTNPQDGVINHGLEDMLPCGWGRTSLADITCNLVQSTPRHLDTRNKCWSSGQI